MKGRLSAGLPLLGDDPALWSVADASAYLGPPALSPVQVRQLITLCAIQPSGRRRSGPRARGRYPLVYPASQLIAAYDAVYRISGVA